MIAIQYDGRVAKAAKNHAQPANPPLALPTILVLHGSGGHAVATLRDDGWIELAEEMGFVLVAPVGQPQELDEPADWLLNPRVWNAGQPYLEGPRRAVDDVRFFDVLLQELRATPPIDPERIFLAGHSGGGGMAFRLAAERAENWAGLAVVASPCWQDDPRPSAGLPTLFIVGTQDPLLPLAGGEQTTLWWRRVTPPVDEVLEKWARALGCAAPPVGVEAAAGEARPTSDGVETRRVADCGDAGVSFTALLIEGQGHRWPGGKTPSWPGFVIGPETGALDATRVIGEFFAGS